MTPNWDEIKSLASQEFVAARGRIINDYTVKQTQLLAELRFTRKANEFIAALKKIAIEQAQNTIVAKTDAWLHAFDKFGQPVSDDAEQSLVEFARAFADGFRSQFHNVFRLLNPKIAALVVEPGIEFDHQIQQTIVAELAEGRRRLREQRSRGDLRAENTGAPDRNGMLMAPAAQELSQQSRPASVAKDSAKSVKTAFGTNIDRLRIECGWSFEKLAGKTGLDKKSILGHVNHGKGAHPRTRKLYADAFTRGLARKVTVAELEGRAGPLQL